MPSPWITRAQRSELPAVERTSWASGRAPRSTIGTLADVTEPAQCRLDTPSGVYTVADLQRAIARESGSQETER